MQPVRLKLDKARRLEIDWSDGRHGVYPVAYLRRNCPCAQCKVDRADQAKNRLHIVSGGGGSGPIAVVSAEQVGNYALRLEWSDRHGSGIYSYAYLREIMPSEDAG